MQNNNKIKTICATATPLLKSAISIIRVSGPETYEIVSKMTTINIHDKKENTFSYSKLYNNDKKLIDEVLLLFFKSPKSYTGEDMIEINCHGNPIIVKEILLELVKNGCMMAEKGEFTRRAVLNGKLNLLQAESVNEIFNANTILQKNISLENLNNKNYHEINQIKNDLVKLIGNLEVNIDYPEYYDIQELKNSDIINLSERLLTKITELKNNSEIFESKRSGLNVLIVGEPNVGKSSLLNSILQNNKAIVSNIPGTTRDVVEGAIEINDVIVNFYDTAGLRATTNKIEKIGINKTMELLNSVDLIFHLVNSEKEKLDYKIKENQKYFQVLTKNDLRSEKPQNSISAKSNDIKYVIDIIKEVTKEFNPDEEKAILTNKRHLNLIEKILILLDKFIYDIKNDLTIDVAISSLYEIFEIIKILLGEKYTDTILDEIFRNFCLGK